MVYGSCTTLTPFLKVQTKLYKEQSRLEIVNQRLHTVTKRIAPYVPFRNEKMLVTLSFMLCLALLLSILCLGGFHLYLTLTAQTTIEFHANWLNRRRAKSQGGKPWTNPYNQGWRKNWQLVFGPGPWWKSLLMPSRRPPDFLPVPIPGINTCRHQTAADKARLVPSLADINNLNARPIRIERPLAETV
jgi:hypothetical protein